MSGSDHDEIVALEHQIRRVLAGHLPSVQSAALAGTLAALVAGYVDAPTYFQPHTREDQRGFLREHLRLVRSGLRIFPYLTESGEVNVDV